MEEREITLCWRVNGPVGLPTQAPHRAYIYVCNDFPWVIHWAFPSSYILTLYLYTVMALHQYALKCFIHNKRPHTWQHIYSRGDCFAWELEHRHDHPSLLISRGRRRRRRRSCQAKHFDAPDRSTAFSFTNVFFWEKSLLLMWMHVMFLVAAGLD